MLTVEFLEENEDVYDITVEGNHNFFADGILVHNCAEISLRSFQFCNLCTINASDVESQADFNERARAAAFIGTLQASYTDFHYLRDVWKRTTEKEALIGISMTGIASGTVLKLNMKEAANVVKEENKRVADVIGINAAARTTTIKPEGCLSLDTSIRTTSGNKTMAELAGILTSKNIFEQQANTWIDPEVDVFIYNENNEEEKITKLYINGMSPVYEIEMDDGTIVKITENHKLKTSSGWKKANELLFGDDILGY